MAKRQRSRTPKPAADPAATTATADPAEGQETTTEEEGGADDDADPAADPAAAGADDGSDGSGDDADAEDDEDERDDDAGADQEPEAVDDWKAKKGGQVRYHYMMASGELRTPLAKCVKVHRAKGKEAPMIDLEVTIPERSPAANPVLYEKVKVYVAPPVAHAGARAGYSRP